MVASIKLQFFVGEIIGVDFIGGIVVGTTVYLFTAGSSITAKSCVVISRSEVWCRSTIFIDVFLSNLNALRTGEGISVGETTNGSSN